MNDETSTPDRGGGELGLTDVIAFFWRNLLLILSVSIVCAAVAAVAAWLTPRRYECTILLMPVSAQSSNSGLGGLASVVSQLGGAASLMGLGGSAGGGAKAEAIATLQSQAIAEKFIQDRNLLPVLFSKGWDDSKQKWISSDPKAVPTLWQGMIYFLKGVITVTDNGKTGLVQLTVTWKDPAVAAAWANELVKATNDYLRDKAIKESQRNIDYLSEQAAKTATVEVRNAIYTVMESEIKKAMIARGSEEYALKVIDPAIPPESPSFPRPRFWTLGGFIIGFVLGTCIAVIRTVLAESKIASGRARMRVN
jgi:uncharacterized protein involved in exopolysaccharide biosynthesis